MCANPVLEFPNITVEGFGRYEVLGSIGMSLATGYWRGSYMSGGEFHKDTNYIIEGLDKKSVLP